MRIEPINGTLHQWDTGRQVQVTLDEGTTLREVRFSHHRSPSPVRVAPEAGGVADIPDELLRHSGMLWVTAIVEDARGKTQTHSRCVCTECAVRPDDYNAGGGSGGSAGGSNVVVVNATMNEDGTITCDMGVAEIHEKIMSGMPAIMNLTTQSGMAMVLTQTNTYQVNEDYEKLMFEQYSMDDQYAVGSNVISLTHYRVTVELDGSATMRGVIYGLNIAGKENMM